MKKQFKKAKLAIYRSFREGLFLRTIKLFCSLPAMSSLVLILFRVIAPNGAISIIVYLEALKKKGRYNEVFLEKLTSRLSLSGKARLANELLYRERCGDKGYQHIFNVRSSKIYLQSVLTKAQKRNKKLYQNGHLHEARSAIERSCLTELMSSNVDALNGQISLLEKGLGAIELSSTTQMDREVVSNKVLYLLHMCLPVHSSGYATRSHGLVSALIALGERILPTTRLGYPHDLNKFADFEEQDTDFDGVHYNRLATRTGHGKVPLNVYIGNYADRLIEIYKHAPPKVIHSASNFINGAAGLLAAQRLGVPFVYEVRGLWEITRASKNPEWYHSDAFSLIKRLETEIAIQADHVLAITQQLKEELVLRGVSSDKVIIAPNAINPSDYLGRESVNSDLKSALGLTGKKVVGYIGSFVSYEGLPMLLTAFEQVVKDIPDAKLLLVGDGEVYSELIDQVALSELGDNVILTGRVENTLVSDMYSVCDLMVYPRYSMTVTEMVSPIKPLEAMAAGKVSLCSNVEPMKEFISEGVNGYLFEKDNIDDLILKLRELLSDIDGLEAVGDSAREWVVENRSWESTASIVKNVYAKLSPLGI